MAGLEEPQDAVREGSLTAVKALFKARTAAGEYSGGMTLEEIEGIFRRIHNSELPAGFHHYYLRLLYLLRHNDEAIARIERYLIPSLLDLSRVDGDFFYRELAGMIKDGVAPAEAIRNLEQSLQLRSAGIMQAADIQGFRFFARKLGRLLAHLFVSRRKIMEGMAAALRPVRIAMTDGGDIVDTTAAVAGSCLRELPLPELRELPVPLPGFRPAEVSDMPVAGHDVFTGLLKGAVFHAVLGRTVVYRKGEEYFAFKFLKKTRCITPAGKEEYETEDPGRLVYESEFFDYLNKLKESDPGLLKGDYPCAVLVDKKRAIRVSAGLIPEEMESRIKKSASKTAKGGEVTEIDDTNGCYTVMAYKTANPDYFTYLHEAEDDGKAREAYLRNIHDLFALAGYGLIHPDIIELFHNIDGPRPDRGIYLWMADILRPDLPRHGAGRIHGWEKVALYPNMRVSGLADFAEIVHLKDLLSLRHHHSDYLGTGLQDLSEEERSKFLLAHYMGNYLLAWALNEGKRLKSSDRLDWKDKQEIRSLAKRLKDVYSEAYWAFTREAEEDIGALVDWGRFATQMVFFMGGAYKEYTDKDIPEEIFGLKGLRIVPGDGWGYIHRDVIEDVLSARQGLKGRRTEPVIEKYFVRPSAQRPIQPVVLTFRPDFAALIKGEKDRALASTLEELHREYSKGWRYDGKNEDLGPVNGPNPLTELLRANYIYTMAMIGRHESPSATDSGNKVERPLSSIPEHEIKKILVIDNLKKLKPKLGESVIDLWPLVTGLHKKFPDATIYVATHFPDMFFAGQFGGKVKPVPQTREDIRKWGYDFTEWRNYTVEQTAGGQVRESRKWKGFLVDKKIDMVFQLSPGYRYIHHVSAKDFPGSRPPHMIIMESPASLNSAMKPILWEDPEELTCIYQDRKGDRYQIAGLADAMRNVTTDGVMGRSGAWKFTMEMYNKIGLDVNEDNLATINLSAEESAGALALLKGWYYSSFSHRWPRLPGSFDPAKKIIVVNMNAVTQLCLLGGTYSKRKEIWTRLVTELIKNTENAYFVFPHGPGMDEDSNYLFVNDVVEEVIRQMGNAGDNIILPRMMDVYPFLKHILGISSGLVTLDSGLSHVSGAVYGVPTAVITKSPILHWLPPGDNVYPIMTDTKEAVDAETVLQYSAGMTEGVRARLEEQKARPLIDGVRAYADMIDNLPERPAARIAKAAADLMIKEWITGKDEDKTRKIEKTIRNTGIRSRGVFTRVKAYLEEIEDGTPVKGKKAPIDIVIDLSLIPARDMRENVETWAYLILSCIRMRNVNFIFEVPDMAGEGDVPESLRENIANAAKAADVLAMLKDIIKEKALLFGQAEDVEDVVGQRINAGRRDNAVEIPIISKACLERIREMDMELAPNQYPVAMDGRVADREGEVLLRNFEAAFTIGLAKACLVVARRRDHEKSGQEKELPLLKSKLVERLQNLYGVFREDVIFTGETLDNMIHVSSTVRLNLAISLALPPITRMYFDRLRDLHDNIQLALQAA
ncbi:MAG: hypothetical protein KAS86_04370 [Candidatus Omnitrophica bacterium]|nr:hypothetical protein [Candidatus Omnitrophota bacterium]